MDAQRNFILDGIKELNDQVVLLYIPLFRRARRFAIIVIMDRGKNLVTGTKEELKAMITTTEKTIVGFAENKREMVEKMRHIPHVIDIEEDEDDYIINFENGVNNLMNLLEFIKENDLVYTKLYSQMPSLNDVFLELTGKELRD